MFKYVFWFLGMSFLICTGFIVPLTILFFMWVIIIGPKEWFNNMRDNNAGNDGIGD